MPNKVVRVYCSICGKISPEDATNFQERMAWLRRHRKESHPEASRKSMKKAVKTKERRKTIASSKDRAFSATFLAFFVLIVLHLLKPLHDFRLCLVWTAQVLLRFLGPNVVAVFAFDNHKITAGRKW
jgi:hypothetical protein